MTITQTAPVSERRPRDDGASLVQPLEGVAVVLIVLSQIWRLVALSELWWLAPLDGALRSGRVANSILVASVGYLCCSDFVRRRQRGALLVVPSAGTQVLALTALVGLSLLAVLGIAQWDDSDTGGTDAVTRAAGRLLTHQGNFWMIDHPLAVRADVAGLWLLGVVVQLVVALALLVLLLGRRPIILGGVLVVAAVAAAVWRSVVLLDDRWFEASLHTAGLVDAFALGALAALAARTARRSSTAWAGAVYSASVLVLVGLVVAGSFATANGAIGVLAPAAAAMTALACLGAGLGTDARQLVVQLRESPLSTLGRWWPVVLAWSQVVVVTVARRTADEEVWTRVLVALVVLVVLTRLTVWLYDTVALRVFRVLQPAIGAGAHRTP